MFHLTCLFGSALLGQESVGTFFLGPSTYLSLAASVDGGSLLSQDAQSQFPRGDIGEQWKFK